MKRLQVGDEIYFRAAGKVTKGLISEFLTGTRMLIKVQASDGNVYYVARFLYPFPCIKELAV